jgi:hypothetical protein
MLYCTFQHNDGVSVCTRCGFSINQQGKIVRRCDKQPATEDDDMITANEEVEGAGQELKAILKDWLGIEATPNCSCNAMARKMDERGPEWCRSDEGMAEILGVMRTEHGKRKTLLPWTDIAARQLVLLACRRAEAKTQ